MRPAVRIAILYPLSTPALGDEGNARVLVHRARGRGLEATVQTVHEGPVPEAEVYLVGGLDESGLATLTSRLRDGGFADRVGSGTAVLAVNAGLQAIGSSFEDETGATHDGVGLLDVVSTRGDRELSGPVTTAPNHRLGLHPLSGFESHYGVTALGPAVEPLARVTQGLGNAGPAGPTVDGAVQGHVVGTYLHGPVLSRNADLADLLLRWAVGRPLEPLGSTTSDALREQRIREDRRDPTGWGGRDYYTTRRRRP